MAKRLFQEEMALLQDSDTFVLKGRVERVVGLTAELADFSAPVGAVCRIETAEGEAVEGEVVGFKSNKAVMMPYGNTQGFKAGDWVRCVGRSQSIVVGMDLLGRIVDGRGRSRDGGGAILGGKRMQIFRKPPDPLKRRRIADAFGTGVRAMDGLLTLGRGQRIGIFSGSGVGKSVLMGMMARFTDADVNVIALVGERGREVREFLEKDLTEEGLKRSVVVVATSDEPALLRVKAALTATTIAEYFRDQGLDVMLMMDSVTRMAMALREIGLSAGEPPATRGYPPSVFATLPRILERSGRDEEGSVTGIYTVLVESDDMNEPIGDACRGILDGHVWLARELAVQHHYPPVSTLDSISRLMNDVVDREHAAAAAEIKSILATYRRSEELINIGAYARGSNAQIDLSIEMQPLVGAYLRQAVEEQSSFNEARERLVALAEKAGTLAQTPPAAPSGKEEDCVKKFNFPLQKVLEYRGLMEEGKLRALGKAVEVFGRRRDELTRLANELIIYRNRLAAMGVGKLSTRELALYRSYLSHCELSVAGAADWMRQAAREMDERRQELVAARKEKRVIERLKEIKRGHYDYEAAREETRDLDEVALKGFLAGRAEAREAGAAGDAPLPDVAQAAHLAPAQEGSGA